MVSDKQQNIKPKNNKTNQRLNLLKVVAQSQKHVGNKQVSQSELLMSFYTSSKRGNSVVLKGHSWAARKEGEFGFKGRTRRKYKTLARRKKGLLGRRPDTILSSRYLPRKEIRNKRSLLRAESGRKVNSVLNKQKSSLFSDVKRGLLYANYTKSNFIFTLTDINGNCISRISSGSLGFDKFTRGSAFAAQQAATQVSVTAGQQGIKLIDIIFKGKGFQNYRVGSIMKGLRQNNIRARRIKKDLRIPHGGCRLRKHRRV
tara:strand:- start:893 stop:1666 length:774 start_codon:yes stop_codon:yes gene_type:complete